MGRGCALDEEGRDRRMAVEISGVTLCPSDGLITGASLDYPRTGPLGYPAGGDAPGVVKEILSNSRGESIIDGVLRGFSRVRPMRLAGSTALIH